MNDTETLYDQVVRQLKSNKLVVVVLVLFAVVLGIAQFQGALSGIIGAVRTPKIEVQGSIRPYDFMGGTISPQKGLTPIPGDIAHVDNIAVALANEIVSDIGVDPTPLEATVRIEGRALSSSQPLQASVLILASPMAQVGRVPRNLGDASAVDVAALFGDTQFVNQSDNAIDMELVPQHGFFQRQPLKVFKRDQGFSFEPGQDASTKVIRFTPHRPKAMLVFGATEASLENTKASLEFALRSELQKHSSLELSPLTQAELDEQKKRIQGMGAGIAKSQLADKYNVDYMIEANVLSR
jgi:hypothetical protein